MSGGNDDDHVQPRYGEFFLAPAPAPLDERTVETSLQDASRLVAVFEQQPDNDAAFRRLTERLDETLTAIETAARPATELTSSLQGKEMAKTIQLSRCSRTEP